MTDQDKTSSLNYGRVFFHRAFSGRAFVGMVFVGTVFSGLLTGCSNHGSVEVLESQLRDREDQISSLRDALEDEQYDLQAARDEADMLRQQLTADEQASPIELTNGVVRVAEIRIHPLLTGPLDTDADGTNDRLIVLLQPRDDRHRVVEAVGEINVRLTQDEHIIQQWTVAPDEAMDHWRSSDPGSGIMLQLPLDQELSPASHLIDVKLSTANNQTFTAQHALETR